MSDFRFRPLSSASQGSTVATLYLDASACPLALLDAAERRVGAVTDLLDVLSIASLEAGAPTVLADVAGALSLLLADANDLQQAARRTLQALNRPQAASPISSGA